MSIAKTTRPHLLTREAAAARIEALEAALRKIEAHPDAESRTDGKSYSYPGALMRVRHIARAALAEGQDK